MKVLFIDIDGVLHRCHEPGEPTIANTPLVDLLELRPDLFGWVPVLERLLAGTRCALFVHSSWRKYVHEDDLKTLLGPLRRRFRGCTPLSVVGREESILSMVASLKLSWDDYRVLDDTASSFKQIQTQLILCPGELGVSDIGVQEKLLSWLSTPVDGGASRT